MIEVLQVPSELEQMVALYRRRKPKRVLEIGSWQGGTMRVWLSEGQPEIVVAVDPVHQNPAAYWEWRKPKTDLNVIWGRSQEPHVISAIRFHAPYDWLFIDGDHDDEPASADVELCRSLASPGATLILHDIAAGAEQPETAPRRLFEELREEGLKVAEYVEEPYPWRWAHGIGVVHL